MSDLIERKAAIDALAKNMPSLTTPDGCGEFDHDIQVTDEAYVDCMQIIHELPSAQPDSKETSSTHKALDTISRQAAIDAHYEYCNKHPDAGFPVWSLKILENLPSAQPELIRCKDCKHYEWDKLNDAYCCLKWGYNFPNEDDFCSYAERRTDG